jgi:chromosome segregation ATPase
MATAPDQPKDLVKRNEELKATKESFIEYKESSEKEFIFMKNQIEMLTSKNEKLHALLQQYRIDSEGLKKLEELKNNLKKLGQNYNDLKISNTKVKKQNESIKKENILLQEENKDCQKKNKIFENKKFNDVETTKSLELKIVECETLIEQIKNLEIKLNEQKEKEEKSNSSIKSFEYQNKALIDEREQFQSQIKKLKTDIKSKNEESIVESIKAVLTSRIPMARLGTGEDVSNTVAFLSSDAASYITGETIHVNGGMYMA